MTSRPAEFDGTGVSFDSTGLIALRNLVLQARQHSRSVVNLPGGFNIRRRGNGQDTADSRIYATGDDLRHLDRGATARTGEMHTRTFHEEQDRVTHLVADFRPSMLWGLRNAFQSVAAARALALIGWKSVEEGGRVGLVAFTANDMIVIPPRGRVRGMLDVIGGLISAQDLAFEAAQKSLQDPPLDKMLEGLKRITVKGSEIDIATSLEAPGDRFETLLMELNQRRYPRLLIVSDRGVQDLPGGRYPIQTIGGTRQVINLGNKRRGAGDEGSAGSYNAVHIPRCELDSGAETNEMIRLLEL